MQISYPGKVAVCSTFRGRLLGLPMSSGDIGLKADQADDLFEGCIVAARRDKQSAHCSLR